ncbi:MAG: class I SAM-dependent methyltransferase [Limisphaerales bacterium]
MKMQVDQPIQSWPHPRERGQVPGSSPRPSSPGPNVTAATTSRLHLRISADAERQVRSGHPWVFNESVREQSRAGDPGELAVIYDRRNRFLALGLFDPESPIRVRVLHAGEPQTADRDWWRARLQRALARRHGLFDAQTTGHRWINGESDGWPGLVLDGYEATLVLKLYTAVWLPWLEEITVLIAEQLPAERIVLRLSRNVQPLAQQTFKMADGQVVRGQPLSGPVVFLETGLHLEADVVHGQKTGFFLDQRENRRRVAALARGRDVLNAFSFSGGFSLYAARGGARSATDLDISPHALTSAKRNFARNQNDPAVAACHHRTIQADAFEWLAGRTADRFDLIILDPPSLAKRESERSGAGRAYGKLAETGIRRLRRGGILVAASCSAHVSAEEFFCAVRQSVRRSGRPGAELLTTRHPPDHPATFLEADYLKCIYFQVE